MSTEPTETSIMILDAEDTTPNPGQYNDEVAEEHFSHISASQRSGSEEDTHSGAVDTSNEFSLPESEVQAIDQHESKPTTTPDSIKLLEDVQAQEEGLGPIHWRAPAVMVIAFLAGVACATGHHCFYQHYNQKIVSESLPQKWVTRIGTAFAFLVKMCLAICTGGAFVQQLWTLLPQQSYEIQELDSMFGILRDALQFRHLNLWIRNPMIFALAFITWSLPLAAVITPGTITVMTPLSVSKQVFQVPQVVFNGSNFASIITNSSGTYYDGPSNELYRLALATATQNQILRIPSQFANMTYEVNMVGPGLQCFIGDSDIDGLNEQCFGQQTDMTPAYYAYVPSEDSSAINCTDGDLATLDTSTEESAQIFISATHTWLQCALRAVSYHLNFTFNYPDQTIDVISRDYQNGVNGKLQEVTQSPTDLDLVQLSYQAVMDAFGRIMVGVDNGETWSAANMQPSLFHATLPSEIFDYASSANQVQQIVEGLFLNMTISLFSSDLFTRSRATNSGFNSTLSTNVQVLTYPDSYIYHPLDLLLAYGISILSAAICLAVGLVAVVRNKASYSNDFSTVVRTTRGPTVDDLVQDSRTARGADPLPARVATAKISFCSLVSHDQELTVFNH